MIEKLKPKILPIYPENWTVVQFFLRLQTQWLVGGMGSRTGLNYPGVESAGRLSGVDITVELFEQLQIMELAALKEIAKNANR